MYICSTYESNYYGSRYESLWVVHMSQITMSSTYESNSMEVHMSQITMGSTYESNYYG